MQNIKNILVSGSGGRQMAVDICYENNESPQPVVIYAHGFNGFKDWGNFDLVAAKFAAEGFVFVKFNFSHNGTTPQQPETFADLDPAFVRRGGRVTRAAPSAQGEYHDDPPL